MQYLNGDFEELINKEFIKKYGTGVKESIKYGIKILETLIHEIIRYFSLIYFMSKIDLKNYSFFVKYGEKIFEMNLYFETLIRNWFDGVIDLMLNSFYEYHDKGKLEYIISSIVVLVFFILYYFIIWKIFEEKLKSLLKKSFDLINLIPQEIKNLIIQKLNE